MGNILIFNNLTSTDAHIFGGINFTHDLNTGEEFSIGNTASASVRFTTDIQLPLYTKDPVNGVFVWKQDGTQSGNIITDTQHFLMADEVTLAWSETTNRGRYYITEVTKEKDKYNVTAYDAMILLDTSITALSLTYPLSVSAAASAVAAYIGCTVQGTINNGTMTCDELDDAVTCRQLLGWAAEASGASVKIDGSDHICFMYYADSGITISASEYKEFGLEVADYTCAAIDNVTICDRAGMTSATAGAGTNSLFIVGNPFLYEATNTEAATILGLVDGFVYAPLTCEMFEESGLEVGTIATFGTTPTLVMHLESGENGAVASSVGSDSRAEFNKTIDMVANEALSMAQETGLHFWYTATGDEAGAHIAEVDRATFESNPSGGNLLSRPDGVYVRDGLEEVAVFGESVRVGRQTTYHTDISHGDFNIANGRHQIFGISATGTSKSVTAYAINELQGLFLSTESRSGSFECLNDVTYTFTLNGSVTETYNTTVDTGDHVVKTLQYGTVGAPGSNTVTLDFHLVTPDIGSNYMECSWEQVGYTSGVATVLYSLQAVFTAVLDVPQMDYLGDITTQGDYTSTGDIDIDGDINVGGDLKRNNHSYVSVNSATKTNISIGADSDDSFTLDVSRPGYTAVGVVGYYWDGTGCSFFSTYRVRVTSNTLYVAFRNFNSNGRLGNSFTAYILYIAN